MNTTTISGPQAADIFRLPRQPVAYTSPLVGYALKGLRNCWLPERQCWSHAYHLDGREPPNQSIPASDAFYSLNVLLGLSRVSRAANSYDYDEILRTCARRLLELPVRKYAYGMALWASAEMGRELPDDVSDTIHAFMRERDNWPAFHAQDLGMILTGLVARARAGDDRGRDLLEPLFRFLCERYASPSGLFHDAARSYRRNFASFATQTYLTIACYCYFEQSGDERARELADACVRKLIALQGPQGEWPWFYHVPSGRVVDMYEVYSVHQDGMAPAFLQHAEHHGVPGARDALLRGFNWILGHNQLGLSMLRPEIGMIVRSQRRKEDLDAKFFRVVRSAVCAWTGSGGRLIDPGRVVLRPECRSYHLGWMLWSFGRREDLPEVTHAPAFAAANLA